MKNLHVGSGLVTIIIGVILFLMPSTALVTILRFVGIVLIIMGVLQLIAGMKENSNVTQGEKAIALIAAIAGAVVLLFPGFVVSLFPLIAAAVIILNGISNLLKAFEAKKGGDSGWVAMCALSIVTIIAGIIVFRNPFSATKTLVRIIGAILIYNGVTGTWMSAKQS